MTPTTDLARLAVGTAVLVFASWTDWRWRRAPNVLWIIVAVAGALLLGADLWLDPAAVTGRWPYLAAIPAFVLFIYIAWRAHLIAGGADAKALMAIAVLLPFPVTFTTLPLLSSVVPGAMAVLANSLLAFLLVPVGFAVTNVARGSFRLPHIFLGQRVETAAVGRGYAWPMERVVNGRVVTSWFPQKSGDDPATIRDALDAAGRTTTWVTPKVPFMIPLLVGFVATFVVGDVLGATMDALLGR